MLSVAFRQISPGGFRGLIRPNGTILHITTRLAVRKITRTGPVDWRATYSDLVADDWEFFDLRELRGPAEEGNGAQQ